MKNFVIGVAAACLSVGVAAAQPTTTAPTTSTKPAPLTPTARAPAPGARDSTSAAAGDTNQAVATTSANAVQPAKGSNSFTESQAQARIKDRGFGDVGQLIKDQDGIWRGTGTKGGQQVSVWLDYKGNVGQQ